MPVHVIEETDYPFRGKVHFTVTPDSPLAFPLQLRIPGWAKGATVLVNGERHSNPDPGIFERIHRTWTAGDRIEVDLPMQPRISRGFNDSVSIERGPLVFSFGIGEDWVKLRDNGLGSADWQVFPTTSWNYALKVNTSAPEEEIVVTETEVGPVPFSRAHPPVRLQVKGQKIPPWRAEDGAANPLPQSPVTSKETDETLTLIPYAAAKLRVTAFARLKRE
jgi:DUF1680 family protein